MVEERSSHTYISVWLINCHVIGNCGGGVSTMNKDICITLLFPLRRVCIIGIKCCFTQIRILPFIYQLYHLIIIRRSEETKCKFRREKKDVVLVLFFSIESTLSGFNSIVYVSVMSSILPPQYSGTGTANELCHFLFLEGTNDYKGCVALIHLHIWNEWTH